LAGAAAYMKASNLLGADIESHFHVRPTLPHSHFAAINAILIERRLRVADLVLSRATQPDRPWNGTSNVLFSRHLVDERTAATGGDSHLSPSTILKMIAIFDVYGLIGPAAALTQEFRDVIATKIDTDALHKKLILSLRMRHHRFKLAPVGSAQSDIPSLVHSLSSHARVRQGIPKRIEMSDLVH
jgi:hypothetical protein